MFKIFADYITAETSRFDIALRQRFEDILLFLPDRNKWFLVVLENWCGEKDVSQVNTCILSSGVCVDLFQ